MGWNTRFVLPRPWVMDTAPGDDEAPKDPGALQTHHLGYTEKDFEGHRAHTVYVGVHLPGQGYRRRSHHRKHKHHHKSSKDSADEDDRPVTPPAQRVQFILGEDGEDGAGHETHPLFSEMGELVRDGDEFEWKETARWIKFEEDVEEGGNRWSKPHVATLSLHSLFELRAMLSSGTVMLDMEASNLEQVADLCMDAMASGGHLLEDQKEKVKDALLRKHRHQHQRRKEASSSNMARLPIIRSLAEIGRNHSSSKMDRRRSSTTSAQDAFVIDDGTVVPVTPMSMLVQQSMMAMAAPQVHSVDGDLVLQPPKIVHQYSRHLSLPAGAGAASVPQEGMEHSPSSSSIPRNYSANGLTESSTNGDLTQHKTNINFMRKIPQGAEASNVLVGEVDFLEKPLSAFIRLSQATFMGDLTEVPVPTRFIFILLGPVGGSARFHEVGRSMATLMSDEIFHDVAYKARKREHLVTALDEFLDAVTVLPPGEWDPTIRIEPPAAIPQSTRRNPPGGGGNPGEGESIEEEEDEQKQREEAGLSRTGRIWGGLMNDIKRKAPWYWSDFKDAVAVQCIASWVFLYFACLSPIITFGGLLGQATGNNMAAMESLVSGFVCGLGYGFFSGQPLTILGSTGPVLVFETIMYDFCQSVGWDYMCFRFWTGIWVGVILIILVAIDASALVCYITRFTEENFACLIAFIFIYKAIENVLKIGDEFPVNPTSDIGAYLLPNNCSCVPGNSTVMTDWSAANWSSLDKSECLLKNGTLEGPGCFATEYVPDVFLMSVILFLGTFLLSVILKDFKNALFFPSAVRQFISDFGVFIAIFSMTFLDGYMKIATPKLMVPSEFKPTLPNRGWLIAPFLNPFYTIFLAILPALLATILIFMDQQITAVIVNRKENKLKKGGGYHLDLFILAVLIMICSVMGLPWFVAATVLSINHVNSLKLESECAAPGEKPQFLGVREQRVTHILIFATIGLSVALTPMLQIIPMPVLYGVFLYMGSASLKGLQFFDRILIMFMPLKYQPDYMFLRQVPLKRVHLFTAIQLTCLIALWVIKSFKKTSILFPLMLVVMIFIRKLLDFVFTQRELKILDDVMPETHRRSAAEKNNDDDEDTESGDVGGGKQLPIGPSGNLQIPLANGNIMKIPLTSINISEEVNKSGVWKQVNEDNGIVVAKEEKKKSTSPTKSSSKPRKRGSKKDALSEDERHRLSTMTEEQEEDDGGITIKKTPKHEAVSGEKNTNNTKAVAPQASMEDDDEEEEEEEDPSSVTPSTPMLQKPSKQQQEGTQEQSNGLQQQS
ncbi:electrogenic sodium bicarbonate cotransporter 1 isoform X3 [Neocloeon triangulifer]|uniref:electrogenic sodium bicarbonate cotransporter 1 isoform X3 n=1 Tax=Neocloeon triangulifer TaxID=2078957 RepID=UPI00286F5A58|nr:electrogenic sodium bicarbonate cotransporter 1 isoform X3 [Neocloeon triangulifer]